MKSFTDTQLKNNELYIKALSKQFPNIRSAAAEIINLSAIQNLPKATEHFISDIHGEHEAFKHILNNASGSIREKINTLYGEKLSAEERAELSTLIYYPKLKLKEIIQKCDDSQKRYFEILTQLLEITRLVSSKYTRSKLRKALTKEYAYILDELITNDKIGDENRTLYHENILNTIIELGQAEDMIVDLCSTIKRLIIDKLHIVGDIYDRGARPDIVLDDLIKYHGVDIQWGNHDILWMGAACGSRTCIANALNNCFSYGNLDTIEMGYGINLRPLALFATKTYNNSDISCFLPKATQNISNFTDSPTLIAKMHKAIAVIMFKLEGHIIRRNPNFRMADRLLLEKIDYDSGTITIDGKSYSLKDSDFPTINPDSPYELTTEEEQVMEQLKIAFHQSEKLTRHIDFLFKNGSLYKCYNNNLLIHGCVPMNDDKTLMDIEINGELLHGKMLLDTIERIIRCGYNSPWNSNEQKIGKDLMWFLWCGKNSPLFGREKMCSFERLLINEEETHVEMLNAYYSLYNDEESCIKILKEFGINSPHSHIINGHIPVKRVKGESPIKANGKLIVIDGGFCRSYQEKTGTAGYTLVYNSYGMNIIAHEPFSSVSKAITENKDILSKNSVFEVLENRIRVKETEDGKEIQKQIDGLKMLLWAYHSGFLKENLV